MSPASYTKIGASHTAMKSSEGVELDEVRLSDLRGYAYEGIDMPERPPNMRRFQMNDIAYSASFLTIPITLLTIALLAMIFGFQVKSNHLPFPRLASNLSLSDRSDVFYVNLPATTLIFVASWMSSLAPISIGLAMSLALYPVADRLHHDSANVNTSRLLTPYQLAIALKFAAGSIWSALLDLTHYRTVWQSRAPTQGRALQSLTRIGTFVLTLTLLVLGADTWLHIVTKTVPYVRLTEAFPEDNKHSFSLLSPNCTTTDNSFSSLAFNNLSCTIDPGAVRLQNGLSAIQALNDKSSTIRIYNNGPDPSLVYFGIASARTMEQYDYTATTLGMRAVCRPMARACGLGGKANSSNVFAYNCNNGSFTGELVSDVGVNLLQQAYFYDFNTRNRSEASTLNPYEYVAAFASQTSASLVPSIRDDPDIFARTVDDYLAAVIYCSVTAYNVEYDMVNGSVSRLEATPSNASTVNVFTPGLMQTLWGDSTLQSALQLVAVTATSAQDLADQYAVAYSRVALSIGAGSVVPSPALEVQRRDTILVARVPKAPLLLLIAVNLLFIGLGIVLTILALRSSHHAYQIQLRFGVSGVVAAMFGGKGARRTVQSEEHLFDEYRDNGRSDVVGVQVTSENDYILRVLHGPDRDVLYGQNGRW